jgi:hypothetical protein
MKQFKLYLALFIILSMCIVPGIVFNHIHPYVLIIAGFSAVVVIIHSIINYVNKNKNQK